MTRINEYQLRGMSLVGMIEFIEGRVALVAPVEMTKDAWMMFLDKISDYAKQYAAKEQETTKTLADRYRKEGYQQGYDQGYADGYEDGLDD